MEMIESVRQTLSTNKGVIHVDVSGSNFFDPTAVNSGVTHVHVSSD